MTEQVPSDQSDTPKTDDASFYIKVEDDQYLSCWQWVVDREFARDQERRIAELVEALKVQVGYCVCGGSGKRHHSWEPKEVPCQRCADAHALIAKRVQS
jgi:hypothetical protein